MLETKVVDIAIALNSTVAAGSNWVPVMFSTKRWLGQEEELGFKEVIVGAFGAGTGGGKGAGGGVKTKGGAAETKSPPRRTT